MLMMDDRKIHIGSEGRIRNGWFGYLLVNGNWERFYGKDLEAFRLTVPNSAANSIGSLHYSCTPIVFNNI